MDEKPDRPSCPCGCTEMYMPGIEQQRYFAPGQTAREIAAEVGHSQQFGLRRYGRGEDKPS